jgi:hypothetical protein
LGQRNKHCRYASPRGCRLQRLQRPFVCTWYICPAQIRLLQTQSPERARLAAVLQQIKTNRRLLEDLYIQTIFS